ncbi:MAG: hypothetical protein C9356_15195 [Oleiphilus sp.]|nr:MAG: hypothetical protein C9356_15195 [Oleiphilus sp.]
MGIDHYLAKIDGAETAGQVSKLLNEIDELYLDDKLEVSDDDWSRLTQCVAHWKRTKQRFDV